VRHPIRVLIQDLKALESQLRGSEARGALPNLVGEAEGLRHGHEGEDGVEGGALLEGFGEDASAAAVEDVVDAAEDFGCCGERLVKRPGKGELCVEERDLLLAWISHEYMASIKRGLQSLNPW